MTFCSQARTVATVVTPALAKPAICWGRSLIILLQVMLLFGLCVACSRYRDTRKASSGAEAGEHAAVQRPASPTASVNSSLRAPVEGAPANGDAGDASKEKRYFGSFSEADVRSAVGYATPKREETLRFRISEWKARPSTIVALSFHAIPFGAELEGLRPRITVLEALDGKLSLVAEGGISFSDEHCENGAGEPLGDDVAPTLEFDLAPYTIAPGNTAIGVRVNCHYSFPAGEGDESRLKLLEIRGSALRQIFDERITWDNHDRVGGDTGGKGIIVVQKTKHDGYFDLELRMKTTTMAIDSEPEKHRKVTREQTRRFTWNGTRYAPAR